MREHGVVASAEGLGVHDHACWAYAEHEEFRAAATGFLADGVPLGQRLMYVGGRPVADLRRDLSALEDVDLLLYDGRLEIHSLHSIYPVGRPIDAEAQLSTYSEATDRALADSHSGLRVAAEVTPLVTDPATWEACVCWESVVDRYMASRPLTALCAYDRRHVPGEVMADLAAVHPVVHVPPGMAPFRVFSQPDALAIEGEIDSFSTPALGRLLDSTTRNNGDIVLDLRGVAFIDHHGLTRLLEWLDGRREGGRQVSVRNVPYPVQRLCDVLDVSL